MITNVHYLQGVYALGFNNPSKIQETALPTLLADPPQVINYNLFIMWIGLFLINTIDSSMDNAFGQGDDP